jgi:hypothetical protein
MPTVGACNCDQGWICEEHPDRQWPHDECAGPGTQCHNPECSWWQPNTSDTAATSCGSRSSWAIRR